MLRRLKMKKGEMVKPIKRASPPKRENKNRFVEVAYKPSVNPNGKPVKVMTRRTLQGVRKV